MPLRFLEKVQGPEWLHSYVTQVFVFEMLGTALLVFFGDSAIVQVTCGNRLYAADSGLSFGNILSIAASYGLGLAMSLTITMATSGGHLNPAVTLAQAMRGHIRWSDVPIYFAAQYLGAFLGAVCVFSIHSANIVDTFGTSMGVLGIYATYPGKAMETMNEDGGALWYVVLIMDQFWITFVFILVVLAVTDDKGWVGKKNQSLAPVYIGLTLTCLILSNGSVGGSALNPARDLAPRIWAYISGHGEMVFFAPMEKQFFWIPAIVPYFAALAAIAIYKVCIEKNMHEDTTTTKEASTDEDDYNPDREEEEYY